MQTEILEVRQVPTEVIPPPPGTVELTNAQADVAAKTTAFDTAKGGLESALDTAMSGLTTAINGIKSQLETDVGTAQTLKDGNLDTINSGLDSALGVLDAALDAAIDGFDITLDGDLDLADSVHDGAMTTARSQFETDQGIAEAQLTGDIATENATFNTTIAGFEATMNSAVAGAESILNSATSSANASFAGFVAGQQAASDAAETGLWATYVAGSGSAPGGVINTFNAAMAVNDAALASVVAMYPTVTYDPSSIINSQAHLDFVQAQQQTLMMNVIQLNYDLQNDVQAEITGITTDIYASGGPAEQLNNAISLADQTYSDNVQTAQTSFNNDVAGYFQTYNTAVNGLNTTLNTNLQNEETTFNGALVTARGVYDALMLVPKFLFDQAVDNATDGFANWIQNVGGATLTSSVTSRKAALQTQIDGYVDTYDLTMHGLNQTLNTQIKNADIQYWNDVYGPGGPAETFRSTRNTEMSGLQGDYQAEYTTYQTEESNYQSAMMDYYYQMMTNMMLGLPMPPMPSTAALDQAAKDYYVNVTEAEANVSDSIGTAYVGFWGAERGFDNTRDTTVVNAVHSYGLAAQGARNSLQSQVLTAYGLAQHDIIDYTQTFTDNATTQYQTMMTTIGGARNSLDLAHNSAVKVYELAANAALKTYKENVAGYVRDFRKQEAD